MGAHIKKKTHWSRAATHTGKAPLTIRTFTIYLQRQDLSLTVYTAGVKGISQLYFLSTSCLLRRLPEKYFLENVYFTTKIKENFSTENF